MVFLTLRVEKKRRKVPALYFLKPSQQFQIFEEILSQVLDSLDRKRTTNRALIELMNRKGWKKLNVLRRKFRNFDRFPLRERKAIYNAFYRIFQRYYWAMESGSEKEIELKVWITSSLDYLCEFVEVLEEKDD